MASNINPNNIDGSYPIAGQDNNSQGFRDNFTNTKVNFQYAEDEINDLQQKVLLKGALTGTTLDNNMNNNTIYAVNLNDVSTDRIAITTTSGTVTVNYASGSYQTVNPTAGSITLAFSNWPASGYYGRVRLAITVSNTAYTVTLPAAVSQGIIGIAGYSANVITFAATGTYVFDFASADGGTTITMTDISRPLNRFSNGLLSSSASSGIGYTTGAGSAVTQGVGRTNGVTINALSGAITLVSAAGTSAYTTFTVTNSAVAATDLVIINQKSGTDKYLAFITAVGASSFNVTFSDVSGTTTEQPVFNFAVIKGIAS
jgi:hypothetical protein